MTQQPIVNKGYQVRVVPKLPFLLTFVSTGVLSFSLNVAVLQWSCVIIHFCDCYLLVIKTLQHTLRQYIVFSFQFYHSIHSVYIIYD